MNGEAELGEHRMGFQLMLRRRWRLLLYVFGIPVLAWGVLSLVQMHQNSVWDALVRKDFPGAADGERAFKSLQVICRAPELKGRVAEVCTPFDRVTWLRRLALAIIAIAALQLALVHWMGQRCRRNRQVLLTHFRAMTYWMTGTTLILMVAQALLIAGTIRYGWPEYLKRSFSTWILMIGVGVLAALYKVGRLLFAFSTI